MVTSMCGTEQTKKTNANNSKVDKKLKRLVFTNPLNPQPSKTRPRPSMKFSNINTGNLSRKNDSKRDGIMRAVSMELKQQRKHKALVFHNMFQNIVVQSETFSKISKTSKFFR